MLNPYSPVLKMSKSFYDEARCAIFGRCLDHIGFGVLWLSTMIKCAVIGQFSARCIIPRRWRDFRYAPTVGSSSKENGCLGS